MFKRPEEPVPQMKGKSSSAEGAPGEENLFDLREQSGRPRPELFAG